MAKINTKIDKELRKEVITKGVFLGTVIIFGFDINYYLYNNEVYGEEFKFDDDVNDYTITNFYQTNWEMINTNMHNGKFNQNEPYAEPLIEFMNLYSESLYLGNKKYREIAKVKFAELKKDYEESGLLDDINALLKKSKSKTFRYSTVESLKESINGDCYVYFDDEDNKRWVFCDYVKGITNTRNWWLLTEDIIDAIHVFKNEKQAQKFIDNDLKYFADQDKVVIAEYPQTISGFFESKKSATKSLKESKFSDFLDTLYDMISYAFVGKGSSKTTKFNVGDFIVTTMYMYSFKDDKIQADYHVDVEDTISDYTAHLNFSDSDSYLGYIKQLYNMSK